MKEAILNFLKDEEGLTMIEYAVAGGMITLGAVGAFKTLGTNVGTKVAAIDTAMSN